jgi:hypothetical protein
MIAHDAVSEDLNSAKFSDLPELFAQNFFAVGAEEFLAVDGPRYAMIDRRPAWDLDSRASHRRCRLGVRRW